MAGTKGRRSSRKRRGGGAEETDQDSCHYSDNTISQQSSKDQEILSSPVFSRYPTRRSREAFAQSATLPSPLRNPLRSIKRTPSHSSSLNPTMRILSETHDEPLSGNRDNKLLDLNNPTLELISQCRGPREVQQTAPLAASHQDLLDSYRPSRENYVVSHGDDRPEKSTNSQCLSRCNSLNITDFQEYLSFKEEEAKYDVSIGNLEKGLEVYQNELSDLHQKISLVQQKISVAEEELVANKAKADQIKKVALDIKASVNALRKQTLVHGLL
ncbi:hypothetical protein Pfo_018607 [Paulownia fortunei]|nr:hypothetical protein Pfo_018607 [Paulownia fortunei]